MDLVQGSGDGHGSAVPAYCGVDLMPAADGHVRRTPSARASRRWPDKNGCKVSVSITIPDSTKFVPSEHVRRALLEALDGHCPAIAVDEDVMTVVFLAGSGSAVDAAAEATRLVPALTGILGQDPCSAFRLTVTADTADSHPVGAVSGAVNGAVNGGVPACVGVGEAAEILGVTKQRVHQLARVGSFPSPVMRLKATPVWRRDDVIDYSLSRNRVPGPAPRS